MIEKKSSTVGALWAIACNGDFLRKACGTIEVWSTERGAENAALKNGGKPVHLNLTQVDHYKPKLVPVDEVLEVIKHIKPYYDSGIARTTVCEISTDTQCNVLRHRPLGSSKRDTREVGDEDMIVEIRIKLYVDVKSMQDINKQQ